MKNRTTAILKFKTGDDSWRNMPEEIWRKLLAEYFFELADSFSFDNAKNADELSSDSIFNFLDDSDIAITKSCGTQQGGALFQLNPRTKAAIAFPSYGNWLVRDGSYRQGCTLRFFSSLDIVASCWESEIEFHRLDAELYRLLCAVDPSIAKNLWVNYEMTALYLPPVP